MESDCAGAVTEKPPADRVVRADPYLEIREAVPEAGVLTVGTTSVRDSFALLKTTRIRSSSDSRRNT